MPRMRALKSRWTFEDGVAEDRAGPAAGQDVRPKASRIESGMKRVREA